MTTDNVAEMTPEQLRRELAQRDRKHKNNVKMIEVRGKELGKVRAKLAQARAELAAVDESLGEFYCPVLDPKTEEPYGLFWKDHGVHLMKKSLDHAEAALVLSVRAQAQNEHNEMEIELIQARQELKDLRGANRTLGRQLTDETGTCKFWHEAAQDAEVERDEWRRVARQERAWVRTKEAQIASTRESVEWLWGFWEGETLVAKPGYEDDIREAWGKLLVAVDSADDAISGRLAMLDALSADRQAAEAALADCGIAGINASFTGLADAINQMAEHIKELSEEHDQLIDRVEDAMGQIEKYDKHLAENLIQYAVEDILERLVNAERELKQHLATLDTTGTATPSRERIPERLTKADIVAYARDLAQTVDVECRLRQDAERARREALTMAQSRTIRSEQAEHRVRHVEAQLSTERRLRQKAEHRAEALDDTMKGVHEALDECQVKKAYVGDGCPASARTRIFWLNQRLKDRTERAEALAQLVNKETAGLLERLASNTRVRADSYANPLSVYVSLWRKDAEKADTLAAQIREALDDSQA